MMNCRRILACLLGLALSSTQAGTEINGIRNGGRRLLPDPYQGVVTNVTVTPIGQKFYRYFVSAWREKELSDRYAISIHERATARWGSQVWVEYAHRRMFQAFLPPAENTIRTVSEKAVEIVYDNIMNADVQRLLFRDEDIGPDEM